MSDSLRPLIEKYFFLKNITRKEIDKVSSLLKLGPELYFQTFRYGDRRGIKGIFQV
jgi:hypothetical protein